MAALAATSTIVTAQNKTFQPEGWSATQFGATSKPTAYVTTRDTKAEHFGHPSGLIESTPNGVHEWGLLQQTFRAEAYRGRRVRLSGFIKADHLNGWAGLWMRVSGFDRTIVSDSKGTTQDGDWTPFDIVLDIPQEAQAITMGSALKGAGKCWVSDVSFNTVNPNEVKVTQKPYELQLSRYLPAVQNLDFSQPSTPGSPVPGWIGLSKSIASGTGIDKAVTYRGKPAIRMDNPTQEGYGGDVLQLVKAAAYRGKRVRFTARVAVEPTLRVEALIAVPGGGKIVSQKVDTSGEVSGAHPEWRLVSVVADIPSWAQGLQFGVRMLDQGYGWVADATFEVVDPSTPLTDGGSPIVFRENDLRQLPLSPENLDFDQ